MGPTKPEENKSSYESNLRAQISALTAEVERLKAENRKVKADTFREAAGNFRILSFVVYSGAEVAKILEQLADRAERGEGNG